MPIFMSIYITLLRPCESFFVWAVFAWKQSKGRYLFRVSIRKCGK